MRGSMPPRPEILAAVDDVVRQIGEPFVLAFVRRGDKALMAHDIDAATQPVNIAIHVASCVPLAAFALYIATDEFRPDFFAPLFRLLAPQPLRLWMARNVTATLRQHLERSIDDQALARAAEQRWLYLLNVLAVKAVEEDAVPVLLDNNALFVFERELARRAAAQICTQTERCPKDQAPLDSSHKWCAWSLQTAIEKTR